MLGVRLTLLYQSVSMMYVNCFAAATPLVANATFGSGDGPIVANVACNGAESRLMDCTNSITHGCVHSNDIALRCTATSSGKVIQYRSAISWHC